MSQSHVTHLHKPADDPRPVTHESRKILTYPKNWSIPIIRLKALTFMTHRSENLKKWQNLEQVPSLLLKRLANDPRPVAQESQNLNQPPKASKSQKGVHPFSTIFSIFLWLSTMSHKVSRHKKNLIGNYWIQVFLSDPGVPGVRSMGPDVRQSLHTRLCADLTDVTLADEDSNSIPTDDVKRQS